MSAFDDLNNAVSANTAAVNAAVVALEAGSSGTPDSALEPLTAQLTANNAALTAATPAPATATPAPSPAPSVAPMAAKTATNPLRR